MRILAIDFGERRVGVAISDPRGLLATPWGIVARTSNAQVAERIAGLVGELDAGAVLLGMPLDAEGGEGYQARRVLRFAEELRARITVPLVYWDESLTSADAAEILRARRPRRGAGRRYIDDVAAAVLLQSYLDRQAAGRGTSVG